MTTPTDIQNPAMDESVKEINQQSAVEAPLDEPIMQTVNDKVADIAAAELAVIEIEKAASEIGEKPTTPAPPPESRLAERKPELIESKNNEIVMEDVSQNDEKDASQNEGLDTSTLELVDDSLETKDKDHDDEDDIMILEQKPMDKLSSEAQAEITETKTQKAATNGGENGRPEFPASDQFGIPQQQDHNDTFGLNTKVMIISKGHFNKFFAQDPKRPNFVLLNVERIKTFASRLEEPKVQKFLYPAKLRTWMLGNLELEQGQRETPYTIPAHMLAGYSKDEKAKEVADMVQVQKMEKARLLLEKGLTPGSEPSQIKPAFLPKKIFKALQNEAASSQAVGNLMKHLAGQNVTGGAQRKPRQRGQKRKEAMRKAAEVSAQPQSVTKPPEEKKLTETKEVPPLLEKPLPTTTNTTAKLPTDTNTTAKQTVQPSTQTEKRIEERRTFPQKSTPTKAPPKKAQSSSNSRDSQKKTNDSHLRKKGVYETRRRDHMDQGNRKRSYPGQTVGRGSNIFPVDKRVRIWDTPAATHNYPSRNTEPAPFIQNVFQDPYRPIDPYSPPKNYPSFASMAQSSAPFGTPQSGFPYGSSSSAAGFGYSSYETSTFRQGGAYDDGHKETLQEIRRLERELEVIRQKQQTSIGASSFNTGITPVASPPRNTARFGDSFAYNYSSSTEAPQRFSSYGY